MTSYVMSSPRPGSASGRCGISSLNAMQREFLPWMFARKRGVLVAPCGNGKSLCVTALQELMSRRYGRQARVLVVTRTKAMVAVEKANFRSLPVRRVSKGSDLLSFHPSSTWDAPVTCLSSTLLPKLMGQPARVLGCFWEWLDTVDLLVVDELHDFKVYKSAQSVALRRIADRFGRRVDSTDEAKILGITATPVHKSLENWHTLMSYIEPRLLGTWWQFLAAYCVTGTRQARVSSRVGTPSGTHRVGRTVRFQEITGYKDVDLLYERLSPYVFTWAETDFVFSFVPRYYSLTGAEERVYADAIRGRGLDRDFHITLRDLPSGREYEVYRDKSDLMATPDGRMVRCDSVRVGSLVSSDGSPAQVLSSVPRERDATHTVRMIEAQKEVSAASAKLHLLSEYLLSSPDGCLVYCNYKDTVEEVRRTLSTLPLARRIVVITGDTPRIRSLVESLSPSDIVLVTRVAQQSLDFYFRRLVLFEIAGLTPGSLEQLCGRLSRFNSPYREIEVMCPLRDQPGIEGYFYERLRLHLKTARSNVYTRDFPPSMFLPDGGDVSVQWLKRNLLWRV